MTDIVQKGGPKVIAGLAGRCVVDRISWNPSQASREAIGVHREFFFVGRFLFVYFIFYGKND